MVSKCLAPEKQQALLLASYSAALRDPFPHCRVLGVKGLAEAAGRGTFGPEAVATKVRKVGRGREGGAVGGGRWAVGGGRQRSSCASLLCKPPVQEPEARARHLRAVGEQGAAVAVLRAARCAYSV
jgi:hypothetical protein